MHHRFADKGLDADRDTLSCYYVRAELIQNTYRFFVGELHCSIMSSGLIHPFLVLFIFFLFLFFFALVGALKMFLCYFPVQQTTYRIGNHVILNCWV